MKSTKELFEPFYGDYCAFLVIKNAPEIVGKMRDNQDSDLQNIFSNILPNLDDWIKDVVEPRIKESEHDSEYIAKLMESTKEVYLEIRNYQVTRSEFNLINSHLDWILNQYIPAENNFKLAEMYDVRLEDVDKFENN